MNPPLLPESLIDRAARRLKVLGEPVRLHLLNLLRIHGELSVQELVDASGQRQANVSKHLGILAREGLVDRRKEGVSVLYSIGEPSIQAICLLLSTSLKENGQDAPSPDSLLSQ